MALAPTVPGLEKAAAADQLAADGLCEQIAETEEQLEEAIVKLQAASKEVAELKASRTFTFPSRAAVARELTRATKEHGEMTTVVEGLRSSLSASEDLLGGLLEAKEELQRRTDEAIANLRRECPQGRGGVAELAPPSVWRRRLEANWREAQEDPELYARALYGENMREDYSFMGLDVDELEAVNDGLWQTLRALEDTLRHHRSSGGSTGTTPRHRAGSNALSPRNGDGSPVSPRDRSRNLSLREPVAKRALAAARAAVDAQAGEEEEAPGPEVHGFSDFWTEEDTQAAKRLHATKETYNAQLAQIHSMLDELDADD